MAWCLTSLRAGGEVTRAGVAVRAAASVPESVPDGQGLLGSAAVTMVVIVTGAGAEAATSILEIATIAGGEYQSTEGQYVRRCQLCSMRELRCTYGSHFVDRLALLV